MRMLAIRVQLSVTSGRFELRDGINTKQARQHVGLGTVGALGPVTSAALAHIAAVMVTVVVGHGRAETVRLRTFPRHVVSIHVRMSVTMSMSMSMYMSVSMRMHDSVGGLCGKQLCNE